MPAYLGALTVALLPGFVLVRLAKLRKRGIRAMQFGQTDKNDFLIPPFVLLYFYLIFARAFQWPSPSKPIFEPAVLAWGGVLLCFSALCFMYLGIVSFGNSFRVGVDVQAPGDLVTTGIFAITRNPLYVAFAAMLSGEVLIQPSWLMLLYAIAGLALLHRQVLREETFMASHYGEAYRAYCARVPRYL